MAMQAPDPLQENISRTQVGDEQVGTDVEALLQSLRTNEDETAASAIGLHLSLDLGVEQLAVLARESTVMKSRNPATAKDRRVVRRKTLKRLCRGNCGAMQVANDQHLGASFSRVECQSRNRFRIGDPGIKLDTHRLLARHTSMLARRRRDGG